MTVLSVREETREGRSVKVRMIDSQAVMAGVSHCQPAQPNTTLLGTNYTLHSTLYRERERQRGLGLLQLVHHSLYIRHINTCHTVVLQHQSATSDLQGHVGTNAVFISLSKKLD